MTRTIVFHHPVPGSGFTPRPTLDDDVVIVCPDRPGYGRPPAPVAGDPPTIAGTTERLLEQLRRQGIDHIDLVVGWSGGGHYALAMAALAPDTVDAVEVIATPAHDDDVSWIPDHLRPEVARWRAEPEQAIDRLLGQLSGVTGRRSMLCAGRDDDRLLATDSTLRMSIDRMLAAAFRHGPAGMAHDIVAQHVTDWGFEPDDIHQPVRLVYADRDPIVPIAHGRHWAETLPTAELSVIGSAGHLTPLQCAWDDHHTPTRTRRRRRRWRPDKTIDPFASLTGTDHTGTTHPFAIRHRPPSADTR